MKYAIYIKHHDGTGSYLSHKGRTAWTYRTAKKHLADCVSELVSGGTKWASVRHFAIIAE